ncbi:MAG: hypothetical protein HRU09_08130 [Oligoflexales bacterium]|nr:hypothetical protein [Oligoflexales bacterium]
MKILNTAPKIKIYGLVLLASLCLGIALACAHKQRKWLLETPVQDMVSHTLLESVGFRVLKLPELAFDDDLKPFIGQFVEDAKKRGVVIPEDTRQKLRQVVYVDKLTMQGGPGVMAACNRFYTYVGTVGGKRKLNWMTIEVLRKESAEYIGTNKEDAIIKLRELMYHELFHCFMNKGHLPPDYDGIMSPTFIKGSQRAVKEWDALVDDMFSPLYLSVIPDAGK